jgi:hypothetical protein
MAENTLVKQADLLSVRLRDHRHNLRQGLLEKSKLAQYAYEEGHRVSWDDTRILDIERNR